MKYLSGREETDAIKWMNAAAALAKEATCLRARCGTAIVSGGEIIGKGYNAPPLDDTEHRMCERDIEGGKPGYDRTCCMHAEWRAIMDALRKNPERLAGARLYFVRIDEDGRIRKSGKPYCTVCSRLALDSGIGTFLLWHDEGISEYPTDEYNALSYAYVG